MIDAAVAPAIELINVTRRFLSPGGKSLTAIRDATLAVADFSKVGG